MNIGGLDRKITIEEKTTVANEYGERAATWVTYATVWANIERKPAASERVSGEQVVSFNSVIFLIRNASNVSDVSPAHRIQYNNKTYEILGVHEVGRSESLRLITQLLET